MYERELKKGKRNRVTLAVARRLVAYMMAVDKAQTDFESAPERDYSSDELDRKAHSRNGLFLPLPSVVAGRTG